MAFERKYIYGIVQDCESRKFSFSGVGDAEVFSINHREVAAIISDTGLDEIDPTRKNVRAHTGVQEELLKTYTLLPMGFGTVAANEGDVLKLLEKNYRGLFDELKRLSGKIELELKVFWDQDAMVKELQGEREDLTRLRARIKAASSPLEAQRLLMEAGKLVEHIVLDWKAKYADRVYAVLKELSVDARLNDPMGVKNILNASFLIERAKEGDFQKEVHKLDSQYQAKMNFKVVGPLAPYNFVKAKLELVN